MKLSDARIRGLLVAGLSSISIQLHFDAESFIEGREDIPLRDLDLDSLVTIYLCTYIENEFGVLIDPDQLAIMTTLSQVARWISQEQEQPGG